MKCDHCGKPATCRGMEKGTKLCYTHSFEEVQKQRTNYYDYRREVKNGLGNSNVERGWSSQ